MRHYLYYVYEQWARSRTSKALKGKKKSDSHRKNLSEAITNYYKNLKFD